MRVQSYAHRFVKIILLFIKNDITNFQSGFSNHENIKLIKFDCYRFTNTDRDEVKLLLKKDHFKSTERSFKLQNHFQDEFYKLENGLYIL